MPIGTRSHCIGLLALTRLAEIVDVSSRRCPELGPGHHRLSVALVPLLLHFSSWQHHSYPFGYILQARQLPSSWLRGSGSVVLPGRYSLSDHTGPRLAAVYASASRRVARYREDAERDNFGRARRLAPDGYPLGHGLVGISLPLIRPPPFLASRLPFVGCCSNIKRDHRCPRRVSSLLV